MADYATLIWELKEELKDPHVPVIGFGGSYGECPWAWIGWAARGLAACCSNTLFWFCIPQALLVLGPSSFPGMTPLCMRKEGIWVG